MVMLVVVVVKKRTGEWGSRNEVDTYDKRAPLVSSQLITADHLVNASVARLCSQLACVRRTKKKRKEKSAMTRTQCAR